MIPIECPKCGRGGNIPPDRLNARLVCKACQSVFHMDTGGRLMLGEPGKPDLRASRHAEAAKASAPAVDFEFSDALKKIPAPLKFGLPAAALAAVLWSFYGPGPGAPDYVKHTESLVRAVAANDRPQVLASATTGTADGAGKWFDMVHDAFAKKNVSADANVIPTLWGGEPSKSPEIQMSVIVAHPQTGEQFPVPLDVYLSRAGSRWALDGSKTFAEAEKQFASLNKKATR